jgi:hypothetical protein
MDETASLWSEVNDNARLRLRCLNLKRLGGGPTIEASMGVRGGSSKLDIKGLTKRGGPAKTRLAPLPLLNPQQKHKLLWYPHPYQGRPQGQSHLRAVCALAQTEHDKDAHLPWVKSLVREISRLCPHPLVGQDTKTSLKVAELQPKNSGLSIAAMASSKTLELLKK